MRMLYPKAKVERWIDGDTIDAIVDLGFNVLTKQRFRLAGINTPEKGQPGFNEAVTRVNELAPIGSAITVECLGYDKYGRWISNIMTPDKTLVNEILLKEGLALPYIG